ncbi:MAG: DUF2336 domain-containing protein [Pseudomonadota bacterium]
MRFFRNLFSSGQGKSKKNTKSTSKKRYEKEKKIVATSNLDKKRKIAASSKSHPEILYYLAADKDVEIRRSVARNNKTPLQASDVLVRDKDEDVRLLLAERLVRLLPDLAEDMQSQLYAFAVKALGTLARDEVDRIRASLSSALKDHAFAPPSVIKQLAKDIEREVSEPILRHCTKLSDEDLIEIISHHPAEWAVEAVSKRRNLSEDATEKLIDTVDEKQGRVLLENGNIKFSRVLLEKIIEKSRAYLSWQEPVALRPELSYDLAQQLVGFAQDAVINVLANRKDFDKQTADEIADMVRRRAEFAATDNPFETLEQKVNRYAAEGKLNTTTLMDALAWQEEGFVKLAIARLAGVHQLIVEKIFASQSAKSIVSLCWHAGLSMRLAVELQKTMGRVPISGLIYAKSGIDYPLPEADMIWQLEFFGIEVNPPAGETPVSQNAAKS